MSRPSYDPEQSRIQLQQAEESLSRGDVTGALAFLEAAFACDPHNDELPLLAATLQLRQGDPLKAAHLAADAARLRPLNPHALDVLGVCCIDALQPELAQKILRRAQKLTPGLDNIKSNLRDAKRRGRELKQARIPKEEILRASHLLPHKTIGALIEDHEPRLEALIFISDEAQLAGLQGAVDSVRAIAGRVSIGDVRPDDADPLPSRDDGVEIFRGRGPELEQRNQAWKRCTGDWILTLEANERLTPDADEGIAEALDDATHLAHALEIRRGELEARWSIRLVRNAAGVRFHGRLDPQLLPSLTSLERNWGLALGAGPIATIESEPWDGEDVARQRDGELADLVERDAASNPSDTRAAMERAVLEMAGGRAAQALDVFQKVRSEISTDPTRCRPLDLEEPTILEAYALLRLERYEELSALVDRYHLRFPECANTVFLAGAAARGLRDGQKAAELFEQCLDLQGAASHSPVLPEIQGVMLPNMLGTALLDAGRLDHAREAFDMSLERDPDNLEAQLGMVALRYTEGKIEEILTDLDRLVDTHGNDPKVWVTGGIVLGQYPKLAPATIGWLEEACKRFPEDGDLLLRLADAQLRLGEIDHALANYDRVAGGEDRTSAARAAAALASDGDLPQIAADRREPVSTEVLTWFQRWMAYGAYETLDRALLNLRQDLDALPGLAPQAADWLERIGQGDAAVGLRPEGDSRP